MLGTSKGIIIGMNAGTKRGGRTQQKPKKEKLAHRSSNDTKKENSKREPVRFVLFKKSTSRESVREPVVQPFFEVRKNYTAVFFAKIGPCVEFFGQFMLPFFICFCVFSFSGGAPAPPFAKKSVFIHATLETLTTLHLYSDLVNLHVPSFRRKAGPQPVFFLQTSTRGPPSLLYWWLQGLLTYQLSCKMF